MSQNSQANFKNLTACGASMSDHFGTLDIKGLSFNVILKLKTIHGRTQRNKIKKTC